MTNVVFLPYEETLHGVQPAKSSVSVRAVNRRVIDDVLIMRRALTFAIDQQAIAVNLLPTPLGHAYHISVAVSGGDTVSGYYKIPDVETIKFTDLVEVDPESLEPTADPDPEWWAMAGKTVTDGRVDSAGNLILTHSDGRESNAGHVKGGKGDKGDRGATGAQGVPGERGAKGEPGVKGDKGDPGAVGATGAKGDKGDTGARGAQGIQGIQGIQGVKGDKGDKGDPGAGYGEWQSLTLRPGYEQQGNYANQVRLEGTDVLRFRGAVKATTEFPVGAVVPIADIPTGFVPSRSAYSIGVTNSSAVIPRFTANTSINALTVSVPAQATYVLYEFTVVK